MVDLLLQNISCKVFQIKTLFFFWTNHFENCDFPFQKLCGWNEFFLLRLELFFFWPKRFSEIWWSKNSKEYLYYLQSEFLICPLVSCLSHTCIRTPKVFSQEKFHMKGKKKQIHTNLPISCPISKSLRISFLNGDCIYTKCFGVFDFGHDLWFWEIIFLGSYKKSRISDCNIGKNKPNQLMDIWYHVRLIFSAFALSIFLGLTVPVLLFFMFKLVNRMRESLVLTEIYYSKFAPLKQKAADFLRHNHITIGSKVSKNQ